MSKFIIHVANDVLDSNATDCIAEVIRLGKISADGKSYCYVTTFKTGIHVVTRGTQKNGTTTFHVYNRNQTTPPTNKPNTRGEN